MQSQIRNSPKRSFIQAHQAHEVIERSYLFLFVYCKHNLRIVYELERLCHEQWSYDEHLARDLHLALVGNDLNYMLPVQNWPERQILPPATAKCLHPSATQIRNAIDSASTAQKAARIFSRPRANTYEPAKSTQIHSIKYFLNEYFQHINLLLVII